MLLSEFIERTGVTPSAEEYVKIEANYYEFPGDKDQFCRAWVKANPASVKVAKAAKALQSKKSKLFRVIVKLEHYANMNSIKTSWAAYVLASGVLKASDLNICKEFGVIVNRESWFAELHERLMTVYKG